MGHSYAITKITIFKTLRRLNTTWNFARSITRVSTHEHEHWEHCLCTQSLQKRRFLRLWIDTSQMTLEWCERASDRTAGFWSVAGEVLTTFSTVFSRSNMAADGQAGWFVIPFWLTGWITQPSSCSHATFHPQRETDCWGILCCLPLMRRHSGCECSGCLSTRFQKWRTLWNGLATVTFKGEAGLSATKSLNPIIYKTGHLKKSQL